jgi:alpha-L-fucosidase
MSGKVESTENTRGVVGNHEGPSTANSRAETLRWFREAKFGLFIHYGLYSLLGRGEWVQYHEKIPIAEYRELQDRFTARAFDADAIADLARAAGMRYVNLVCKHCDSFCLWDTDETEFNSVESPAGRDLVGELSRACAEKGLGFFAFYEHGFDWRHPHGPAPWDWDLPSVRPHYDPPDPYYASREDYDFERYLDYVRNQISELLTGYGQVTGIWLDGAAVPLSGDTSRFRLPELYARIRELQPQALISYKWGVHEEAEDFLAPEENQLKRIRGHGPRPATDVRSPGETDAAHAKPADTDRRGRPLEICATMQKGPWGYKEDVPHLTPDEVMQKLRFAAGHDANLLLNVGPLGDGSIHPDDEATLREVGRRLASEGWPTATR